MNIKRDYRGETLTQSQTETIIATFDKEAAVCFAFDKGFGKMPRAIVSEQILEAFPEAILACCRVEIKGDAPRTWQNMNMIILPPDHAEALIKKVLLDSGIVSQALVITPTRSGARSATHKMLLDNTEKLLGKATLCAENGQLMLAVL